MRRSTSRLVKSLRAAVDALSSAIAGFALLAGARAFMFIALLGWREPVLGGAGKNVMLTSLPLCRPMPEKLTDSRSVCCCSTALI